MYEVYKDAVCMEKNNMHIGYIKDQGSYIIIVDEQAGHVVNLHTLILVMKRGIKKPVYYLSAFQFLKTKQRVYVYSCELCHVTCLFIHNDKSNKAWRHQLYIESLHATLFK